MQTKLDISSYYSSCTLCPNMCHTDRFSGAKGICGQSSEIKVAWAGLHKGEEPPISGKHGSGMIFFCGCPLHCRYCQNYQISSSDEIGKVVSEQTLAKIMIELQNSGAATLNLVTGTHYIPSIINALILAKQEGFNLPVVWNSSGYETVESLRLIDPFVDLYLVDLKTIDRCTAEIFCGKEKYVDAIFPVMQFLKKRHPVSDVENNKGVLVRHLVFPGKIEASLDTIKFYGENFRDCSEFSLMVQFVPPKENPGFKPVSKIEYKTLIKLLDKYLIEGYVQTLDDNEYLWIPDFTKENPFPKSFATALKFFTAL